MPVNIDALVLFALASAAIVIVPGPTVTVIVANSLNRGARAGLMNIVGTQLGLASMLILLALGFGSLVTRMGPLFEVVRVLGAIYLVWLGVTLWRANGGTLQQDASVGTARALGDIADIKQGFIVIWANPKALVLFGAFMPQFVDIDRPALPQLLLLGLVFMLIGAFFDGIYAVAAGRAGRWLTRKRARLAERIAALFLVLGGLWLALTGLSAAGLSVAGLPVAGLSAPARASTVTDSLTLQSAS